MSPRPTFEMELKALSESIIEMCEFVETSYEKLFTAIELKDEETTKLILEYDRKVNDMEREIESKCLTIITRQQPVAKDLRIVSAALKVVTDLERVGDHVSDIAELVLRMKFFKMQEVAPHLTEMIEETRKMVHDSVHAFVYKDVEACKEIIKRDDIVDELFNLVKNDLVAALKHDSHNADDCVDILMVAKYLEKIADHGVNIAEWLVFEATGNIQEFRIL